MAIERITLNFNTSDPNSALLCKVLQCIKRGKRMEVIADNILANLVEHNLLATFGSSPEAIASILTTLSNNYRLGITPQPHSSPAPAIPAMVSEKKKVKKQTTKKVETIKPIQAEPVINEVKAEDNYSVPAPVIQQEPIEETASSTDPAKQVLNEEAWIVRMNEEALKYFKTHSTPEQYQGLEEGLRCYADEYDKYEDLVSAPGFILSQAVEAPSNEISFEEWLTQQLNNQNIFKE